MSWHHEAFLYAPFMQCMFLMLLTAVDPTRHLGSLQADKLLSPEFQPVIEQLIAHVKPDRQIMLYSATFPVTVKHFKDRFLNKPYIVNLMEDLTLKGITQVSSLLLSSTLLPPWLKVPACRAALLCHELNQLRLQLNLDKCICRRCIHR